jgi:uncharacterized protein YcnI
MMKIKFPLLALTVLAAFSVTLMAHISVNPRTSEAGIQHKLFYIRAPVELAIPVVELGLEVSEEWRNNGGDLNSFEHVPGWNLNVEFNDEGKVTQVVWSGGEAPRETFQMFHMSMNVPEEPGDYTFKAWQKYGDGKVVWFNEPADGEYPMPLVKVEPASLKDAVMEAPAGEEHFLSSGVFHLGSGAVALLALAISLVSIRNGKKGAE